MVFFHRCPYSRALDWNDIEGIATGTALDNTLRVRHGWFRNAISMCSNGLSRLSIILATQKAPVVGSLRCLPICVWWTPEQQAKTRAESCYAMGNPTAGASVRHCTSSVFRLSAVDFDKGWCLIIVTAILSTTLLFSLDNTVVGFSRLKIISVPPKYKTDLLI